MTDDETDNDMTRKEALKEVAIRMLGGSSDTDDKQIGSETPIGDARWPQQVFLAFERFDEIHIDYDGDEYVVVERDGGIALERTENTEESAE